MDDLRSQLRESHDLIAVLSKNVLSSHAEKPERKDLVSTNDQLRKELRQLVAERDALESSNEALECALMAFKESGAAADGRDLIEPAQVAELERSLEKTQLECSSAQQDAREASRQAQHWCQVAEKSEEEHARMMSSKEKEHSDAMLRMEERLAEKSTREEELVELRLELMATEKKKVTVEEEVERFILERREKERVEMVEKKQEKEKKEKKQEKASEWFLEAERLREEVKTLRSSWETMEMMRNDGIQEIARLEEIVRSKEVERKEERDVTRVAHQKALETASQGVLKLEERMEGWQDDSLRLLQEEREKQREMGQRLLDMKRERTEVEKKLKATLREKEEQVEKMARERLEWLYFFQTAHLEQQRGGRIVGVKGGAKFTTVQQATQVSLRRVWSFRHLFYWCCLYKTQHRYIQIV